MTEAQFISVMIALADTGRYRDAQHLRAAAMRNWPDGVAQYWADDLQLCLDLRCRRVAGREAAALTH